MAQNSVEDECLIKKGDKERWMSVKEANDALKVKEKFGLDHEPACVFFHKRDKKIRVNLGIIGYFCFHQFLWYLKVFC